MNHTRWLHVALAALAAAPLAALLTGCTERPGPRRYTADRPSRATPSASPARHASHDHPHGPHPHVRSDHHHHPHPHPHLAGDHHHHPR